MNMNSFLNDKGMILRIEKTSIHDGSGLRTVVFIKGCPLRCWWCSAPESHNMEIEKGYLYDKCTGCSVCIKSCPEGALTLSLDNKINISKDKCNMNLACYEKCPSSAYKKYGRIITVDDLVKEIAKDEIFYYHSDGGVTFSGGEPLIQAKFVSEVMKQCRRRGINTAMETSLFAPFTQIEKVLPYLDVLYVDIKHMDNESHKKYTGVNNSLILKNILKVDSLSYPIKIFVRIPLIPFINDSEENLLSTIEFCKGIHRLQGIELLPYHRLGVDTYRTLGLKYKLTNIAIPTVERIQEVAAFMSSNSQGIPIRTGGGFS